MSLIAQAKVLRAVEYGEFERLGDEQLRRSRARIISATNAALHERIREGRFREDLYCRLAGLTICVPALRNRVEDLPGLIATELQAAAESFGKKAQAIHPEAMARLLRYTWPGNLRELAHTARTIMLFCEGTEIQPEHVVFQPEIYPSLSPIPAFESVSPVPAKTNGSKVKDLSEDRSLSVAVDRHIRSVYESSSRNRRLTARTLGISRAKLDRHLERMASK